VAILWLVGAEAFLAAGIITKEVVFRRLGLLRACSSVASVGVIFANSQLAFAKKISCSIPVALLPVCCRSISCVGVGSHWKDFFKDSPGRPLLTVHSYLVLSRQRLRPGHFSLAIDASLSPP